MSPTMAPAAPALEVEALEALVKIQEVVKRILNALPVPFERPSHLQHYLKLDAKVAWHLFKLTTSKDPLAAAQHVPGRLLMQRIGQAALRKGVPIDIVESAQSAIEEFETVVKQHASTRTAFKAMVSTIAGDDSAEGLALQHRHTAFNVQSQLWGEQVDLLYKQAIFVRESQNLTTTCWVSAKRGLQLLRPDTMPLLEGYLSGAGDTVQALEPQAAAVYGTSLLPSFCSQPIPQFKTEQRSDGWRYSVLQNASIGRRGAIDLAFGRKATGDTIGRLHNGESIIVHGTRFITPTAVGIDEIFLHRPSFPVAQAFSAVFGDQTLGTMEDLVDYGRRLPSVGTLQCLGNAAKVNASPHSNLPRYEELQQHVFARLGWDRSEFDVYRVVMNFPILHSIAATWFKI